MKRFSLEEIVASYCLGCSGCIGYDPDEPNFCTVCWDHRKQLPPEFQQAVLVLAQLTKNAPSYEVTVQPFADAHQEACEVLDKIQRHHVGLLPS